MKVRKKSLKLYDHERKLLIEHYLSWRIPIDQFEKRPDDRQAFVDEWNKLAKRQDDAGDVIHYHLGNYDPHIVPAAYSTKGLWK